MLKCAASFEIFLRVLRLLKPLKKSSKSVTSSRVVKSIAKIAIAMKSQFRKQRNLTFGRPRNLANKTI